MKNLRLLTTIVLFTITLNNILAGYYFYIQFKDKNNSPFSLSNPSEFLSERAINRRLALGIEYNNKDIPVNTSYINQVLNIGDIQLCCKSKWMNGITVLTNDSNLMSQVRLLSSVDFVQYTGKTNVPLLIKRKSKLETSTFSYGSSSTQINQLKINYLHNLGYTGKNIHIAILDAGFSNANTNPGFDSLRLQNRLLGTKDIAEPNSNIYNLDTHGANVLSILAGNLPGQFIGSAPHASYWLIRTEYVPTEYLVETDFWVAGVEFADSVGADLINSSLGYTTFDDPAMSFSYNDMNGTISRASKAATIASNKGIIVCNSAGNDGNNSWHYIGSPADAMNIFTVGAATSTGSPSSFTSYGPTADNRIKPEICGMGTSTALINNIGNPTTGNGTSYSCPVVAGAIGCFIQYLKENHITYNFNTLADWITRSANLYNTPTDRMGFGIPDFQLAVEKAIVASIDSNLTSPIHITYDRVNHSILLIQSSNDIETIHYNIFEITGKNLDSGKFNEKYTQLSTLNWKPGVYLLKYQTETKINTLKFIIQ